MKKLLYLSILTLSILLSSCTLYDSSMQRAGSNPIPHKLPNLNCCYSGIHGKADYSEIIGNVIKNDISENFISLQEEKIGDIVVDCKYLDVKKSWFYPVVSIISFGACPLMGLPIRTGKVEMKVNFEIKSADGSVIREYEYSQKKRVRLGLYYGADVKTNVVEVSKGIMNEFRYDINKDNGLICDALEYRNARYNNYTRKNSKKTEQYYADDSYNNNRNEVAVKQEVVVAQIKEETPKQETAPKTAVTDQVKVEGYTRTQQPKKEQEVVFRSDVDINIPVSRTQNNDTYALIIANENYTTLDHVNYAIRDGETFAEYCKKTLGIPQNQVLLYKDVTLGNIYGVIDDFARTMNIFENSQAIIYYCGHGICDEKTKESHIVPVDGSGTNMVTCYSLAKLYETMSNTKAKNITYFIDACFSGANRDGSMLVAARGVAVKPKNEKINEKTVVFAASSGDETAMPFHKQQHGLFTYYLLKKIQESSGNVTYEELRDYLTSNVQKEAHLTNRKPQTPTVLISKDMNEWGGMRLKESAQNTSKSGEKGNKQSKENKQKKNKNKK